MCPNTSLTAIYYYKYTINVSSYLSFVSPFYLGRASEARHLHHHHHQQQHQHQHQHQQQESREEEKEEEEEGGARGGGRGGGGGQRGGVTDVLGTQRGPVVIKFNIDHDTFEGPCL